MNLNLIKLLENCGYFVHITNKEGVWIYATDNHFLHTELSDEMKRLTGSEGALTSQLAVGRKITDCYKDDDELLVVSRALKGMPTRNFIQVVQIKGEGEYRLMMDCLPITDEDGNIEGAIVFGKDYDEVDTAVERFKQKVGDRILFDKNNFSTRRRLYDFSSLICTSSEMKSLIGQAKKAARAQAPIILIGQTGTGKELFAQSIHKFSDRFYAPFVAVNCSAIPGNLFEAELFGTAKGAFTGAVERAGFFEKAHGGTLFLDELNSLDLEIQPKLLRVLQTGRFSKVGSTKEEECDVRLVSAVNIDPLEAMEKGDLRSDLYYRIAVIALNIPPLCERLIDIPVLCRHFLKVICAMTNRPIPGISPEVMEHFMEYSWPGNVRELNHVIAHALYVMDPSNKVIRLENLPSIFLRQSQEPLPKQLEDEAWDDLADYHEARKEMVAEFDAQALKKALKVNGGNISRAAKHLGITRQRAYEIIHQAKIKTAQYKLIGGGKKY